MDLWWLDWCCDGSSASADGLSADAWINSLYAARNQQRGSRWPVLSRIGGSFQGGGTDGDAGAGDGGAGVFAEHRYSIHFTGDTCATWPMLAFESQFTAEEGNAGLPYVSHDIGSFNGPPLAGMCTNNPGSKLADDIYVRWVQFGAFQPLDRLHSNHGARLPWEYAPPASTIATDFLRLREALVPYLYTLAREAYDTGLPLARALYLQWPELPAAYENPTEYTLGNDMLLAPVTSPGDPAAQQVWIPPGTWIDYFTGERFTGPTAIQLDVPLDRYPVFVRAGAIVPTQPAGLPTTSVGPQDPMTLTTWSGAPGALDLYDDQGQGLAYRGSGFTTMHVTSNVTPGGCSSLEIAPARGTFAGAPATRAWQVRLVGIGAPRAVSLDGRPLAGAGPGSRGWAYDQATETLTVTTGERSTHARTAIGVGPPQACACAAAIQVRVRAPRRSRVVRVDVYVATRARHGRPLFHHVLRRRGRRLRQVILRSPPSGPFTLELVARTSRGRRITTVRRYGACGRR